ncbi:MAG TPA: molybdate ABC transporter substrate-binding protein [Usitatibacter sp.]|jgi:molybdate transport system substrate-binding protein|nr:molybdate ABC transporter substrate-binding protein [Usitatibacter sp.]
MRQRRGPSRLHLGLRRLAALGACLACALAHAQAITVFAAASLKEALDAAVQPYEAASGHRVVVSYAGSNVLARQIVAGAPAALFISADEDWMNEVEAHGRAVAGSRRDLLANDLVLISPAASGVEVAMGRRLDLARALGDGRLALANPDAVPAGKYAKASLVALGAWDGVRDRIAPAENVRAALALVARGEAPLGIVYRTDALAERGVRIVATFPAASHPPIVYPMVVLKGAPGSARELAAHLASPAVRAVWERFGFRVPS